CLCRQSSEISFANKKKAAFAVENYSHTADLVLLHTRGRFGLSGTRVRSLVWQVIRLVRPPRDGWSTQQVQQQQERLAPLGQQEEGAGPALRETWTDLWQSIQGLLRREHSSLQRRRAVARTVRSPLSHLRQA
ncbi:unnamed protein product, partial [Ectocarpus sp. 12 AP-2014]